MAKRLATYRADGDLLDSVAAKAARVGETVTDVITRAFEAYIRDDAPPRRTRKPTEKRGGYDPAAARAERQRESPAAPEPAASDCRHPLNLRIGDMCGKCYQTVGNKR